VDLERHPNGAARHFSPGVPARYAFLVRNAGPAPATLRSVALAAPSPTFTLLAPALPLVLGPGEQAEVPVDCLPLCVGAHRAVAVFRFRGLPAVARPVVLRCGDPDIADLLRPAEPYAPAPRRRRAPQPRRAEEEPEPLDGERPAGGGGVKVPGCGLDEKGWKRRQEQLGELERAGNGHAEAYLDHTAGLFATDVARVRADLAIAHVCYC
jgi:hypothetical protein